MRKTYIAYCVNARGAACAAYGLYAEDDEAAKAEARQYLGFHPAIEVRQDARCVARFGCEARRVAS